MSDDQRRPEDGTAGPLYGSGGPAGSAGSGGSTGSGDSGPAWGQEPPPGQGSTGSGPAAPGAYPPYAPQVGLYAQPTPPVHSGAVISLVLGVTSLVSLFLVPFVLVSVVGVICAPFAIWLGRRAMREIDADPAHASGKGIALAGFITGIVGCVLGVLGIIGVALVVVFILWVFAEASDAATIDALAALRGH